jgi:hypothetical protein
MIIPEFTANETQKEREGRTKGKKGTGEQMD